MANNNNTKNLNVPNLRFPEFKGEWEKNSILVTCIGSTIGKMGMASTNMCTNQQINSIIVNKNYDDNFVYYAINSRFPKYLSSVAMQAVPIISKSAFEKLENYTPKYEEQKKIGLFLSLIDQRIENQSKIIEDLKKIKSSLLNLLFQNNSKWSIYCISDVLTIGNGRDYKHLKEGNIPVYGTGGYMLSVNDYLYEGESVCIGRKGTIDMPMFLTGKFWTVDTLFYTYNFQNILPRFCYYLFTTINWSRYNEASGVPSLSKTTIEKIKVSVPTLNDQQHICSILDSVNNKINIEISILAKFKAQKSYLLRQMFI